ncbi:MAG: hypothetical protein L0Z50_37240 [Verrucomicrobiales bacterium]|nr:hypothetical protein [Verrucomicrobiales bacterium]
MDSEHQPSIKAALPIPNAELAQTSPTGSPTVKDQEIGWARTAFRADVKAAGDALAKTDSEDFAIEAFQNMHRCLETFQDKTKFTIPTLAVLFVAFGYVLLVGAEYGNASVKGFLTVLAASGLAFCIPFACFVMRRLVQALYDFYAAAVLYAYTVLDAKHLAQHTWFAFTDRCIAALDKRKDGGRISDLVSSGKNDEARALFENLRQEIDCERRQRMGIFLRVVEWLTSRLEHLIFKQEKPEPSLDWRELFIDQWNAEPTAMMSRYRYLLDAMSLVGLILGFIALAYALSISDVLVERYLYYIYMLDPA